MGGDVIRMCSGQYNICEGLVWYVVRLLGCMLNHSQLPSVCTLLSQSFEKFISHP